MKTKTLVIQQQQKTNFDNTLQEEVFSWLSTMRQEGEEVTSLCESN